jgi:hypothetical protein
MLPRNKNAHRTPNCQGIATREAAPGGAPHVLPGLSHAGARRGPPDLIPNPGGGPEGTQRAVHVLETMAGVRVATALAGGRETVQQAQIEHAPCRRLFCFAASQPSFVLQADLSLSASSRDSPVVGNKLQGRVGQPRKRAEQKGSSDAMSAGAREPNSVCRDPPSARVGIRTPKNATTV